MARTHLYRQPPEYNGTTPPHVARPCEPARLIHHRRVTNAVLATVEDDGVIRLLRIATADHPELSRLADADRAKIAGAVLALAREGGSPDAA